MLFTPCHFILKETMHFVADSCWSWLGPDLFLTRHRPGSSRIVVQYWQRSSKHTLPSHNISLARAGCVLRHMKEGMEWYSTLSYSLAPFLKPDLTENVGIRFVSVFLFKGHWIDQSVSVVKHPWNLLASGKVVTLVSIQITSGSSVKNIGASEESQGQHKAKDLDSTQPMTMNSTLQPFGAPGCLWASACANRGRIWCQPMPQCPYVSSYCMIIIDNDSDDSACLQFLHLWNIHKYPETACCRRSPL